MANIMSLEILKENLSAIFNPVLALILYKKGTQIYVEEHPMIEQNGEYIFGCGIPVQYKSVAQLFHSLKEDFSTDMNHIGRIPKTLLFLNTNPGNEKIIWYRKPEKTTLYFDLGRQKTTITIDLPGMIFIYNTKNVIIHIYLDELTDNTVLYDSIFPNTQSANNICMGNTIIKRGLTIAETMDNVEYAFFRSYFTGYSIPFSFNKTPTKRYDWLDIKKEKTINKKVFRESKTTLKGLYEGKD